MVYRISFDLSLKRNPYPGRYISLEGIDGSGKTTQVEHLATYFRKKGFPIVTTSEPTAHLVTGKLMRDIIDAKVTIPSGAFQFVYSADRVVNHTTIVEPALKSGKMVLSHRTFWSVLAHGVMDRNQEYSWETIFPLMVAQGLLSHYHQFINADRTYFLDVSVKTALKRLSEIGKGKDVYEREDKLTRIKEGYTWVLSHFPDEFTIIDGEQDVEEITNQIVKDIEKSL